MLTLNRNKLVLLIILIVTCLLWNIYLFYTLKWPQNRKFHFYTIHGSNRTWHYVEVANIYGSNEFLINNPTCKIPKLDPHHPTIKKFFKRRPDLNCNGNSLIITENNTVTINKSEIDNCYYQVITRKDDYKSTIGNSVHIENGSVFVNSEFIKVECKSKSPNVSYHHFYPFVIHKESVEQRIQNYRKNQKHKNSDKFRILMLGIDTVSKSHFLRHLQKTYDFIINNLTYAEIHGYNKIGTNTYPNILSLLTGKLMDEFTDALLQPADVLPLIWKEYMENGYRTQYSEDMPRLNVFNFARKGFKKEPADYYLRTWALAVEPYIKKLKFGCLNDRTESDVILKYTEDFFDLFPTEPLFAFTYFTRMHHDYANQLSYRDRPVRDFLERLHLKGHFNNTILFLFSDHGFRYGAYRFTRVGRREGLLPFMFVITPPWFPKQYPQLFQNLKKNEKRLVSPLDIHATLKDLLHFDGKGFEVEGTGRSISLFKHPIPFNRTCADAAIPYHFCSCVSYKPVSKYDKMVRDATIELVKKINSLTEKYRTKCYEISLKSIIRASKSEVTLEKVSFLTNFLIVIRVYPSSAIYEGSVWYDGRSTYTADSAIERLNFYGNQSSCIHHKILKPYCYCVH